MFDCSANLATVSSTMAKFDLQLCLRAYDYSITSNEEVANEGQPNECVRKANPWGIADLERETQAEWNAGVLSKNLLYRIVEWKAKRTRKRFFGCNKARYVQGFTASFVEAVDSALSSGPNWSALGDAIHRFAGCPNAEHPRCVFHGKHPWKLELVGVPVTTALLRFAHPTIFGILDVNALSSLRKAGITCPGFSKKATQYPPGRLPSYFKLLHHIGIKSALPMAVWEVDSALYVAGSGSGASCPSRCPQRGTSFCTR